MKINYVVHLVLDGTVTDFANNSPINGATVNVKDPESSEIKATANTGSNGRYFFNNLTPGIYLIEAHTDSHKPEQKVSVIKTRDTVNFVLHQRDMGLRHGDVSPVSLLLSYFNKTLEQDEESYETAEPSPVGRSLLQYFFVG